MGGHDDLLPLVGLAQIGVGAIVYGLNLGKENGTGMLCRKPLPAVPIRHVASWTDSAKQVPFEIGHPAEKAVF